MEMKSTFLFFVLGLINVYGTIVGEVFCNFPVSLLLNHPICCEKLNTPHLSLSIALVNTNYLIAQNLRSHQVRVKSDVSENTPLTHE
jgi:hypothetical protein